MNLVPAPLRRLHQTVFGLMLASEPRRVCTRCGNRRFERVPRIGLMQAQVMPFFNLYPWRCVLCGRVIYRTLRTNEEDPANRF